MNLNIGVLVVGSLDWESKDYGGACREALTHHGGSLNPTRQRWRQQRLMDGADSETIVSVPIRYGRMSDSRGSTFTMVFSPEREKLPGTAKAIQCKKRVSDFKDLLEEAVELWVAESNERQRGRLSANWGCITLLTPKNFLEHSDRDERQELLDAWATRVSKETSYGHFGFSPEDISVAKGPVIVGGRLQISWPSPAKSPVPFDLLLATATNPEIGQRRSSYPSNKEIAGAWKNGGHAYYFWCNRENSIHTSDDDEIEDLL